MQRSGDSIAGRGTGGTKALWHKPTWHLCCLSLDTASSSTYSQHTVCVFKAPCSPLLQHHRTLAQWFADWSSTSSGNYPMVDRVVLLARSNV